MAPIGIDRTLMQSLAEGPAKDTLQRLIDSGAAKVLDSRPKDPYREAQSRLKSMTQEMVKSQNKLNHSRAL